MKILFTGASSFTGYWFIKELVQAGFTVVATFRDHLENYKGIRKQRVDELVSLCQPLFCCEFGSEKFIDFLNHESRFDFFCHHAADATDYKSSLFDPALAHTRNTKNVREVLEALLRKECRAVILTGSVFEQNEGAGTNRKAISPYGLSKGLTFETFRYYTESMGIKLGKFVIPNPFGPFEESRFTSYLIQSWFRGKTPIVKTPAYIRDNIHISLLAKSYVRFISNLNGSLSFEKINPSQYPESQGIFAQRFAYEMGKRLHRECPLDFKVQTDFSESLVRINTDVVSGLDWNESQSWDSLANYYCINH